MLPRLTMPPRPPHIQPSTSIRLPRYTIAFLSTDPSGPRGEPTMELRGGFIEHSADVKQLSSRSANLSFESLAPCLGRSRLWNRARSNMHFVVSESFDIKHHFRPRRLTSRPTQVKSIKALSPRPPTFGSAAMQSKSRLVDIVASALPHDLSRMVARARGLTEIASIRTKVDVGQRQSMLVPEACSGDVLASSRGMRLESCSCPQLAPRFSFQISDA